MDFDLISRTHDMFHLTTFLSDADSLMVRIKNITSYCDNWGLKIELRDYSISKYSYRGSVCNTLTGYQNFDEMNRLRLASIKLLTIKRHYKVWLTTICDLLWSQLVGSYYPKAHKRVELDGYISNRSGYDWKAAVERTWWSQNTSLQAEWKFGLVHRFSYRALTVSLLIEDIRSKCCSQAYTGDFSKLLKKL